MNNKNIHLIGTIHKTHEINPNYTFNHLKAAIKAIEPDLLVVEMRQEDLKAPLSFLEELYPPEMLMGLVGELGPAKVMGFDWRGQALEGKPMSRDNGLPKVWELMKEDHKLKALIDKRKALMETFLTTCSLETCQEDPLLSQEIIIDQAIEAYLEKTGYQAINDYKKEREAIMCQNLSQIMNEHPHETLVILTGRSHLKTLRPYIRELTLNHF